VSLALALFAAALPGAADERLVTSLSEDVVSVTSSFTGAEIVLFGTVEPVSDVLRADAAYDVVVEISGPPEDVVARRQERFLGIWLNRRAETFEGVPSFQAVLSTRPLDAIAPPEVLAELGLGLESIVAAARRGEPGPEREAFEAGFLHVMETSDHYAVYDEGVTFLSRSLFRADVPLPATVPIGDYSVEVTLFRNGAPAAQGTSSLHVGKFGFEQLVTEAAHDRGFLYGLATVALALFTGWLAGVIFRRE